MLSFSRVQLRLLMAAGFLIALSAASQFVGARLAPPLILVQAEESHDQGAEDRRAADISTTDLATENRSPEGGARGGDSASSHVAQRASDRAERDLNRMTLDDLIKLPGIGPVIAQRILDYRAEHGPFIRLDQLLDIPGIGKARFNQLLPFVTIGPLLESESGSERQSDLEQAPGGDDGERPTGAAK